MPPGFDAVGPSSAGATATSAAPSWSHVITGSNNLLLAAIACDTDSTTITSISYGAAPMTPLFSGSANYKHSNGQTAGWLAVFKLVNATAGTASITAALSASSLWEAGSLSFSGADTVSGIGTPQSGVGASATPALAFTPNTSGNLIAAFMVNGQFISSATSPSTSRFIRNAGGSAAGGNIAGSTAPATGSSVSMAWAVTADWYGIVAAEVLPVGASGTDTSPAYAATATDLGGGTGSWTSPANAQGSADTSTATWTAP